LFKDGDSPTSFAHAGRADISKFPDSGLLQKCREATINVLSTELNTTAAQLEVLRGMEGVVRDNLSLLSPIDKAWQPTDFLPNMSAEDWREQVQALREPARALSDELLVVLVGDMVTEEALPNYAISLNIIAQDFAGTSDAPWAQWMRGWTAEENRHGDLLNAYLRLTGRVDMRQVELTIHHLIAAGFNPEAYPNIYAGLVYTAFQERATRISHWNVGNLAGEQGNEALAKICKKIAGDEARHEGFYTRMMGEVMDQDPTAGISTFEAMVRKVVAMPGRLMYDGKDIDLFDHFAIVAQRTGVYGVRDYADILRHLVMTWKVKERSVSGEAAKAQDFLCKQADRIEGTAERAAKRLAGQPKVGFSWIYDRVA
jgi:acyl-[acyl-carrier-protein] desaturase